MIRKQIGGERQHINYHIDRQLKKSHEDVHQNMDRYWEKTMFWILFGQMDPSFQKYLLIFYLKIWMELNPRVKMI